MVSTENMSMEYIGLSTDTKPTDGVGNGSTFIEMDTQLFYIFDEANETWILQNGSSSSSSSDSNSDSSDDVSGHIVDEPSTPSGE